MNCLLPAAYAAVKKLVINYVTSHKALNYDKLYCKETARVTQQPVIVLRATFLTKVTKVYRNLQTQFQNIDE